MKYLFLILALIACTPQGELPPNSNYFQSGISKGKLDNQKIEEASGIAASVRNPGNFWIHNDSGHKPQLFLIDSFGHYLLTVDLQGIKNRDWEDIAVGPGPDSAKAYIYIGEIGDNDSKYSYKYIYRLAEPALPDSLTWQNIQVDVITFNFPDRNRDAETLMLDPLTRDLYVVSKREKKVNLYRLPFPQSTHDVIKAELTASKLEFNSIGESKGYHSSYYKQVVAGDISPDGTEILVKTYSNVYYWRRNGNTGLGEILKTEPVLLPYSPEVRGEAVTFDRNGKGYYTISEKVENIEPQLIFYKRK